MDSIVAVKHGGVSSPLNQSKAILAIDVNQLRISVAFIFNLIDADADIYESA